MTATHFPIHSSMENTTISMKLGEIAITCKWKQTANQTSKQRGICIPMECVKAPEVPEQFRALVESVLLNQAQEVLKGFVDQEGDAIWEVPQELFTRTALVESFQNRGSSWLSKQELEISFTASATWKRIASKQEFQTNKTYQAAAHGFKERILKLSGKATRFTPEVCDAILSKLEESDLETGFGQFVVERLQQIKKQSQEVELDLSVL